MTVCNSCGQETRGVAQFCQYCGSTMPPDKLAAPGEAQPSVGAYAGFWLRAGAFVLDWVLLGIVMSLLVLVSGTGLAVGIIVPWLYEALMLSSETQATVGKKVLGITVTDTLGHRLTFGRASGRHFAKYLSSLVFGIGFIMAAFTARKQGLHDLLAGTVALCHR